MTDFYQINNFPMCSISEVLTLRSHGSLSNVKHLLEGTRSGREFLFSENLILQKQIGQLLLSCSIS